MCKTSACAVNPIFRGERRRERTEGDPILKEVATFKTVRAEWSFSSHPTNSAQYNAAAQVLADARLFKLAAHPLPSVSRSRSCTPRNERPIYRSMTQTHAAIVSKRSLFVHVTRRLCGSRRRARFELLAIGHCGERKCALLLDPFRSFVPKKMSLE